MEGRDGRRGGGENKRSVGGRPNTNMPRWAHWRWGENVGSRRENTPHMGASLCLFRGRGLGGRQAAEHHWCTHLGTLAVFWWGGNVAGCEEMSHWHMGRLAMENLLKSTNAPKMGTLVFWNVAATKTRPIWDAFSWLPGEDTGKRDGHAETGMFVACGERDTLQMPFWASAMYLKGGRCEEEEDQMWQTHQKRQVRCVWSKRHITDAHKGVCYMSKR